MLFEDLPLARGDVLTAITRLHEERQLITDTNATPMPVNDDFRMFATIRFVVNLGVQLEFYCRTGSGTETINDNRLAYTNKLYCHVDVPEFSVQEMRRVSADFILTISVFQIALHVAQKHNTDNNQTSELASVSRAMVKTYEHLLDEYTLLSFNNKRAIGARFVIELFALSCQFAAHFLH